MHCTKEEEVEEEEEKGLKLLLSCPGCTLALVSAGIDTDPA